MGLLASDSSQLSSVLNDNNSSKDCYDCLMIRKCKLIEDSSFILYLISFIISISSSISSEINKI